MRGIMERNGYLSQVKFKSPRIIRLQFSSFFISFLCSSCLDLQAIDLPCGGPANCSSPRQCIEGQCVAACYDDTDCEQGESCVRQLCIQEIQVIEE